MAISARRRAQLSRYNRSTKGRARCHRYNHSARGKARTRRFARTEKALVISRRYDRRPDVKVHKAWMLRSYRRLWRMRAEGL